MRTLRSSPMRDTKTVLTILTDGRKDCLTKTIASLEENLRGEFYRRVIIDDSNDRGYARWLEDAYPGYLHWHNPTRLGLAGALRMAWDIALGLNADFIWHQEDDFTFNWPIDVAPLERILIFFPKLGQIALKRQPVNAKEITAGGWMQTHPKEVFAEVTAFGTPIVIQQEIFIFGPSLISAKAARECLDDPGDGLERGFTDSCIEHGYRMAVLGSITSDPQVTHIGDQRTAAWSV